MSKQSPHSYQYITFEKKYAYPYSPHRDKIEQINSSAEWNKAAREFSVLLEEGLELQLVPGLLLMKMHDVYLLSEDLHLSEKIRNRERLKYELAEDILDRKGKFFKNKVIAKQVFTSLDEVLLMLRREFHLGYEKRVVDLWDKNKVVATRLGYY